MSRLIDAEETLKDNGLIEIDGCNVAECVELHIIEGYAENCHITNSCCKDSPNCYFKQLQRLKDKSEKISYRFKQTKRQTNSIKPILKIYKLKTKS